ncbi:hypothetical protein ABIB14_003489, partial [Arthrobacter sp. UYEF3]
GLLGDSTATTNGTPAGATGGTKAPAPAAAGTTTSGNDGIASGTQVIAPVTAPVTLGATSLGLLGDSTATTGTPAVAGTEEAGTPDAPGAPASSTPDAPGTSEAPGAPASGTPDASGTPGVSGTEVGTQGTVQTAGFASADAAVKPAGVVTELKTRAPGAGQLAMTGAKSGAYLAAIALLFSGGLLLALRLTLRRRAA